MSWRVKEYLKGLCDSSQVLVKLTCLYVLNPSSHVRYDWQVRGKKDDEHHVTRCSGITAVQLNSTLIYIF